MSKNAIKIQISFQQLSIAVHKLIRNSAMKIKISTTVNHSPVNWGTGIPYGLPPFCLGMPSCLSFIWFGPVASVNIFFLLGEAKVRSHPSFGGKSPSSLLCGDT